MTTSIWNTCIDAAITKAKLAGTLLPREQIEEMVAKLEKFKVYPIKKKGCNPSDGIYYCTLTGEWRCIKCNKKVKP